MSLRDCLNNAVEKGLADKKKAEDVLKVYDDAVAQGRAAGLDEAEAIEAASKSSLEYTETNKIAKKMQQMKTAQKQMELKGKIENFKLPNGARSPGRAFTNLVDQIDHRINTVKGLLTNSLDKFLEQYGYSHLGITRNKAGLDDIVRSMLDDSGTATSKQFANAMKSVGRLREMMLRDAGLYFPSDPKWLPQYHSKSKLMEVGQVRFVEYHMKPDMVDWDRMKVHNNNLPVWSDIRKLEILNRIYTTKVHDGDNKIVPGRPSEASVGSRLSAPRVLHYKNADAWLSSMEKYGEGDLFEQISISLETAATDIALVQILGPNPRSGINFATDTATKLTTELEPRLTPQEKKRFRKSSMKAQTDRAVTNTKEAFDFLSNANAMDEESVLGRIAAGTRDSLIATLLGTTPLISATSDAVSSALSANRHGLKPVNVMMNSLKQLSPFSKKDRSKALSSGMTAETLLSRGSANLRFTGDVLSPGYTRAMADVVLRANLLSQTTRGAKWAIGMEYMSTLARESKHTFNKIDKRLRDAFKEADITEADWESIRKTEIHDPNGFNMLRAKDILKRTDISSDERLNLSFKINDLMHKITLEGVPEATTMSSVLLGKGSKRGTVRGEAVGMVALLKSFPVAIYQIHLRTYWEQSRSHLVGYMAGMTIAGVMAVQLGELANGRKPRELDIKMLGAGMLKGGGLGILGDFLFADTNKYGMSMGGALAGPFFNLMTDTHKLTLGNAYEFINGKDTNATLEAVEYINRWAPGTRTWYAKLIKERLLVDWIREQADPSAIRKLKQREARNNRIYGTDTWWGVGGSPDF